MLKLHRLQKPHDSPNVYNLTSNLQIKSYAQIVDKLLKNVTNCNELIITVLYWCIFTRLVQLSQ
jgi:hypothetical protein